MRLTIPPCPGGIVARLCLIALLLLPPAAANAAGQPSRVSNPLEDPMIRITSLPIKKNVDHVLAGISRDVSKEVGLSQDLITYYWQDFKAIDWNGRKTDNWPVFVDIYVAGFFKQEMIEKVMLAVAAAIEKNIGVPKAKVFIHTHIAGQGQVYISGEVMHWQQESLPAMKAPEPVPAANPVQGQPLDRFLFKDPAFVFQSLWRFGLIASGGADLGEALTAVSHIRDGNREDWYAAWSAMADHVAAIGRQFLQDGHALSAREAFFRATNYYRAAEIYLKPSDPRQVATWKKGRDAFLEAAKVSGGCIEPVRIPYEDRTLPGYWCSPDDSGRKRPVLILQTGLDGTAEDLYFIMAAQAVKHGYNCLIFEGPGQGELIRIHKRPFRADWEKVVTPVVDFALKRPEVDPEKTALLGYSMGGYLVPRALAFEHRIKYGVVDGGVLSVFDGVMQQFPAEIKKSLGDDTAASTINQLAGEALQKNSSLETFIAQMLWTFQADTPFELFRKLQLYTIQDVIGTIDCEMLVLNSVDDRVAGSFEQSKLFTNALKGKKTYLEFSTAEGGQFHCQNGAPMLSSERILNWLDARMHP